MAKKYISKKDLARVKEIDLLTYLKNYEPQELVRKSRNDYVTRTHSSLHISNGLWCWWAQSIGGKTALKYLIEVENMEFLEAALYLKELIDKQPPVKAKLMNTSSYRFRLPYRNENDDRIISYLVNIRKIDKEIVDYCIKKKLIYESANDHAVIFVGYDEMNIPHYASKRATDSNIKQDIYGSNKAYSFSISDRNCNEVHVFESAIDLLSYMTLEKKKDRFFPNSNYLSLSGATTIGSSLEESTVPIALKTYLKNYPNIKTMHLHLDNDKAGKDTVLKIKHHYGESFHILDEPPIAGKDFNELLIKKTTSKKYFPVR